MSVGGKVTKVILLKNKVYIDTCSDCNCAIFVENDENALKVRPGDIVWWQGGKAYWTTQDRSSEVETELKRIGYSGVDEPVSETNYGAFF